MLTKGFIQFVPPFQAAAFRHSSDQKALFQSHFFFSSTTVQLNLLVYRCAGGIAFYLCLISGYNTSQLLFLLINLSQCCKFCWVFSLAVWSFLEFSLLFFVISCFWLFLYLKPQIYPVSCHSVSRALIQSIQCISCPISVTSLFYKEGKSLFCTHLLPPFQP